MNYRNKKLLRLANECPVCLLCGKTNEGDVVAMHSNQIRDGKGMGIKAHDYRIAFGCSLCHSKIDDMALFTKAEREQLWEEGHRETIGWLFENGYLEVKL